LALQESPKTSPKHYENDVFGVRTGGTRERELEIENQRAQDEALQAYLDQMSAMLMHSNDQPSLYDESLPDSFSTVARARTLTVLARLDGPRKAQVVQFVYEAGLIARGQHGLDLSRADRSEANLSRAKLSGANLYEASLKEADLHGADLYKANLLGETSLSWANLRGANLRGADLGAAVLYEADLSWADLRRAILSGADPSKASVYEEQMTQAKTFEGATMPDGQTLKGDKTPNDPTLEDWLKDKKAHEKNGENE